MCNGRAPMGVQGKMGNQGFGGAMGGNMGLRDQFNPGAFNTAFGAGGGDPAGQPAYAGSQFQPTPQAEGAQSSYYRNPNPWTDPTMGGQTAYAGSMYAPPSPIADQFGLNGSPAQGFNGSPAQPNFFGGTGGPEPNPNAPQYGPTTQPVGFPDSGQPQAKPFNQAGYPWAFTNNMGVRRG